MRRAAVRWRRGCVRRDRGDRVPEIGKRVWAGLAATLARLLVFSGDPCMRSERGKAMITNGLYVYESEALDHGDGGYRGVVVLRDGTVLGGSSFFYFVGTYSCSGGKWKGELTQREHTPAPYSFRDGEKNRYCRIYRNLYR